MKHFTQYLIVLFSSITICWSQNNKLIDSLLLVQDTISIGLPKIKNLEELYYAEIYNNPQNAKKYILEGLKLSRSLKKKESEGIALYHLGNYYKVISQLDSSKLYFNKSIKVWDVLKDKGRKANAISVLAIIEHLQDNNDKALKMFDTVISINKSIGNDLNLASIIRTRATVFMAKGQYKIALDETLKSMKMFDSIEEEPWQDADTKKQIGYIEYLQNNFHESIKYYLEANKIYEELGDNVWQSRTLCELGKSYLSLKKFKKAQKNLNKSLEIAKTYNILDVEIKVLINLALLEKEIGDYRKSLKYLDSSNTKNKLFNSKLNQAVINNELAINNAYLGNTSKSITLLNESIRITDSLGLIDQMKDAYYYRSLTYELNKNYLKALNDEKQYQKLNDSLYSLKKTQQIEELKTIYETEKKETEIALQEKEIKTLNQEVEISNLRKGLYAGGMISFVALSGLLYFGFKQREKKNRIAREKQDAIYKQEIAFKKKELASETLHLVQKNTFINELKENLERIKQSPELFKVEFRRLVMLLKKESAEDKDWEVFKSYFSEVHNNFDNKLKAIHEDISEKEMRLASFLRMNLSTKEIASMLNVLPESVLKSKYRLKKKLKLDKEIDLNHFLNDL